jgi:uncharacterized repeat protein (TIGR03987 family)
MPVAVVLIMAALVLYSISIWSEKLFKGLKLWMVVLFSTGFACDAVGTSIMGCMATSRTFCLHSFCGYLALLIMLLHLLWAITAFFKKGRAQSLFSRYSLGAWFIWIIAFFSGVPKM